MTAQLYLLIAIVAEVLGTSALKASEGFTKLGPSAIVVTSYAVAFYCMSISLKTMPVGIVYAVWAGMGIVLIALIGWLAFGQKLDLPAITGLSLIVAGVVILNTMSKTSVH